MSTLFYNANLLMTGEEYSQGNALEVEDGIITWIGTINPFQKLNDNMENINLNGAYVLPGFLDFESHSYFAEFFTAVENKRYECFQDDWLDDSVEVLKDKGITSLLLPVSVFEKVQEAGNEFLTVIAERTENTLLNELEHCTSGFCEPFSNFYDRFESVPEAIRSLTTDVMGIQRKITVGAVADFSVFEKNPFQYSMKFFANMHCIRIIKEGKTIYDMDEEGENELFNLLMNQTF